MLIGNGSVFNKTAGRLINAQSKGNFYKSGSLRNTDISFSRYAAYPNGYGSGYALKLARSPGGMASYTKSYSELLQNATLAGGRNLEASETGIVSTNNPILDRIISLLASTTGSLSTSAIMDAALLLQASSSGLISSDVLLGAIFSVTATSNGQSSYDVFLTALANIQAEAGGADPLSPQGLVNAMWNAILNDYQEPGSVGEALQNALASVGGGDPASIADEVMSRGLLKLSDFIALK